MNEEKNTAARLASAEQAVAEMHQELNKVNGEIERLDVITGDIDKIIDSQMRLISKKAILERRLELAAAHVQELKGDLLLAHEADLAAQLEDLNRRLAEAKEKGTAEILALTKGGTLEPYQRAAIDSVVLLHREVSPLLAKHEWLTCRHREASDACGTVIRQRLAAENAEVAGMQKAVFEETI